MNIRTMAVKIDFDTYPVVVACLGAGFASIPYPQVEGAFAVINAPELREPSGRLGYRPMASYQRGVSVSLHNFWVPEELFKEEYRWVTREKKGKFSECWKYADARTDRNRDARGRIIIEGDNLHVDDEFEG